MVLYGNIIIEIKRNKIKNANIVESWTIAIWINITKKDKVIY
jgi:hypothetical protein